MKLYVYCLTEAAGNLPHPLRGIEGAQVRQIETEKFSVLVSDFTGESVLVNRENALAHAAIVQNVLERATPLPVRFGTLVTEAALASYLSAKCEALQAKLAAIHDCVEMSVKIIWSEDESEATPRQQEKPGTAFLVEKRREILGGEARVQEAKRIAEWLDGHVGDVALETQINANPTSKMILAAAHLVRRDQVQEYRTRLSEARNEHPEMHFLVSGPWAPYSFANIDLEFKTQFGVS
jgi:hypothetical protein